MSLRSFLLLFLLLVPSFLNASPFDPKLKWKTLKTAHFAIHFYEGEEEVVERLVEVTEEAYQILSKKFDAYPVGRTEVVVVDQEDAANAFAMVIPYNMILLRAVAPTPDSNLADYDEWLREVFLHEYTHIIHISDTRYPAKALKLIVGKLMAPNGLSPGWVPEGIATYMETAETTRGRGRSSYTEMLLRTDILNDQFLKLDQMAGVQYSWPAWRAQYLYGVAFWKYLSETYGEEKIIDFSHRYGASLWFFSLNNKAKKSFGKSFYDLWEDWKGELLVRYTKVKESVGKRGMREGEPWLEPERGESFNLPRFSPSGDSLVYLTTSIHHRTELRLRDLQNGKEKVLLKKKDIQQLSFSPDGSKILYSSIGRHKRYYNYSDLHEIDIESRKSKKLTKGLRLRDPDYSPDGKRVVCVQNQMGRSRLVVYDLEEKNLEEWGEAEVPVGTEFNHPRWSPDGKWIAVSIHEKGQRDLWLVDAETGKKRKKITNDRGVEDRPEWGRRGRYLYYSSDREGIYNIHRYNLQTGRQEKITNLLTGAFDPTVSATGELAFSYYNGRGFEIRQCRQQGCFASSASASALTLMGPAGHEPSRIEAARFHAPLGLMGSPTAPGKPDSLSSPAAGTISSYTPFPKLLIPRYLLPGAALIDNALFLSAIISNNDPLMRHSWFGDVTYRSDNQFVGYDFGYVYSRFWPNFFVGSSFYSVNFGDLFRTGTDFFEERWRAHGGFSFPMGRHTASINYFFEDRSVESGLPAGITLLTLGNYSGIHSQYRYSNLEKSTAAISPERGHTFSLNGQVTDTLLGASERLEQQVAWTDARKFFHLGRHHVIAIRGAGGIAFGDQLIQGNFGLGGSLGESPFTGSSSRVFSLRGLPFYTFSRDRAWVASLEYRLPLFYVERGLGTLPLHGNAAHFALFADLGDAYRRNNPVYDRPLLGVGAELRGEFVIGYYLPITGRLGYGIIVTNGDRIAGLSDALTGADAKNGVVILEVGTSF
ncbi:MAG: PD40 domain-containing protein [Deltaproteobacteria bacterium]|nr:PD40 domain-containing protein [Deltaproteobacteria bacterium]